MNIIRILLTAALCSVTLAQAAIPAMPEIPVTLPDNIRQPLIAKRQPLALRKMALIDEGKAFNQSCAKVEQGSSQHQACLAKQQQFNAKVQSLREDMEKLADDIDAAVGQNIINSMNALAKRLGWSAEEQARLNQALHSLAVDADPSVTKAQIVQAWNDVLARGQDSAIAREAKQGDGPGFAGAGAQTRYQDCAIFALANAAGIPYGVAAARAAKLIGEGEWRDATDRANPQQAIEQQGLNGGEVVMLAEAFGQVEVVNSSDFAKTLKQGRPVMVSVVPQDGSFNSGHEVVLTKAFQHGAETWYEMMDSNQGPQRRLYVSDKELHTMLKENGVAFRPEPGTTPSTLKPAPATPSKAPIQKPDPDDIHILFPGLKALEDKQAQELLFGLDTKPAAPKDGNTK